MSMNDPISDMLTRLRNAIQAGQATVDIPASALKESVCAVLKREGFIHDYALAGERGAAHTQLRVTLRYAAGGKHSVIQGLKRVSKPSLRVHKNYRELRPVRSGLGIAILTTSKGVMTSKQARAARVGGEVLCEIW